MKVLAVFGTRPEAIKLAPVLAALAEQPVLDVYAVSTGQHRRLLDHALDAFELTPDLDLDLMQPGQQPDDLTARILAGLSPVFDEQQPDLVLVQGDTTSALAGALAANARSIPVAHVEAGLRSGDLAAPFPEEGNRRVIDQLSSLWFAPTATARDNLLAEGHDPACVYRTGNTGIDALLRIWERVRDVPIVELAPCTADLVDARGPLILVTAHRRESFGAPLSRIADALRRIADEREVRIAVPVHPNPEVDGPLRAELAGVERIHLFPPLRYPAMVKLLGFASVVLTDSGGLQEEAPSLGRRVLVCRDRTERTEGLTAGAAMLVGTDPDRIVAEVERMLDQPELARFSGDSPYGDGLASTRIAHILARRARARRAG